MVLVKNVQAFTLLEKILCSLAALGALILLAIVGKMYFLDGIQPKDSFRGLIACVGFLIIYITGYKTRIDFCAITLTQMPFGILLALLGVGVFVSGSFEAGEVIIKGGLMYVGLTVIVFWLMVADSTFIARQAIQKFAFFKKK